jgi:Sel1 repeat-containing protein
MSASRACLAVVGFLLVSACPAEKQETTGREPGNPRSINLGPPRRAPRVINLDLDEPPHRSPIKIDLDDTPKRSAKYEAGRLAMKRNDYDTAIVHLRSAAEAGEAAAQSDLGVMILNGYGTTEPPENAEAWFLKAAEQNHGTAQMNLGLLYLQGVVPRNCDAAITWLHKAAQSAVPDAGFELGKLSYFGVCVCAGGPTEIRGLATSCCGARARCRTGSSRQNVRTR